MRFNEPQNFSKYRETEIDTARIGTFTQLEQYPYMSKRFLMQRFLGLSEEEIAENERMWAEENGDVETDKPSLRSVGVTAGGLETDLDTFEPAAEEPAAPEGAEAAPEPEAGAEVPPPPPVV